MATPPAADDFDFLALLHYERAEARHPVHAHQHVLR
jgi:hypothetical protein